MKKWNTSIMDLAGCLVIFLWMGIIFIFSAQHADQTSHLSMGVARAIAGGSAEFGSDAVVESTRLNLLNAAVRCFAHYFLYLVLGILVLSKMIKMKASQKRVGLGVLLCLLYAVLDELHQFFVPGRDCDLKDVGIDLAGAVTGMGLFLLTRKLAAWINRRGMKKDAFPPEKHEKEKNGRTADKL